MLAKCELILFLVLTGEFLEEHRHVLESRLQLVVREIIDTRARSRDELEGAMLVYVTSFAYRGKGKCIYFNSLTSCRTLP